MKRLKNPDEKKKPATTAQISLNIPFSVSMESKIADMFSIACKNDYSNKSQIFKKIIYKRMGVENDAEFQKKMGEPIKHVRNEIYRLIGLKEGDFSKEIVKDFEEYIKKQGEKR
jgi:hypothetical protein